MDRVVIALLALESLALAEGAPSQPPDVLGGERYDGRTMERSSRSDALFVPRLLLTIPRSLVRSLGIAARPVMEWSERNHVPDRVIAALTSEDGLEGVRPVVEYELSYRPAFGIQYFNNRLPKGAQLAISTATGGPEVILGDARLKVPLLGGRAALDVGVSYRRRDDELYTGIGMNSPYAFARYAFEQGDATATFSATPIPALRVEVGGDLGIRAYGNGTPYGGDGSLFDVYGAGSASGRSSGGPIDDTLVPGFAHGTRFLRAVAALHADSRRDETSSGLLVDVGAQYTHGLGDDRSSYLRLRARAGTSIEIWRHRALSLGFTADDEIAFGATPIPFTELVQLGGVDDLRGFQRGRFRDASSLLATAEYRWPIWMWMDGSLFVDYGGVFKPGFADFSFRAARADVGMGVRVRSSSRFYLRVQLAYGFGDGGGFRLVIAGSGSPT
jgi:hypothetical protein